VQYTFPPAAYPYVIEYFDPATNDLLATFRVHLPTERTIVPPSLGRPIRIRATWADGNTEDQTYK
jgi:hypothetical protein